MATSGPRARQFRFNGNSWINVPLLSGVPNPLRKFHQANFVVDVPLAHLVQGVNTLEGTCTTQDFGWGQWGWPQVLLRVYYDPLTKAHPTGAISSIANGGALGENPIVSATASGGAGVSRVDFFANFNGYDPDGDGRYKDWQVAYHRPITEFIWTMSEHVGSDAAAPYSVVWDTTLVPDQPANDIKLVAHIRDANGYVFVTDEVTNVKLLRTTSAVKLYPASNVPDSFWVRAGQTQQCLINIPAGDNLGDVRLGAFADPIV